MELLRTVPRLAVDGYLRAVKWPLSRVARLAPDGELLVDRADAVLRGLAGDLLRDPQLQADARLRREAAEDRTEAAELRGRAAERREAADETLADRQSEAEQRRRAAEQRADEQRRQAAQRREAKAKRAAASERQRKARSAQARAQTDTVNADVGREDRLEALEEAGEAVQQREAALTARDEAERLDLAAARAKERRKA